jgi:hypothetical protein
MRGEMINEYQKLNSEDQKTYRRWLWINAVVQAILLAGLIVLVSKFPGDEQLRDASLTEEALHQTAAEGEPLKELEGSPPFRQMQYALVLDGDLLLMNYGTPGREDYFQALATQWRIGDRSIFLDNVLTALDNLVADPSPEARQALAWAYARGFRHTQDKPGHDDLKSSQLPRHPPACGHTARRPRTPQQ